MYRKFGLLSNCAPPSLHWPPPFAQTVEGVYRLVKAGEEGEEGQNPPAGFSSLVLSQECPLRGESEPPAALAVSPSPLSVGRGLLLTPVALPS